MNEQQVRHKIKEVPVGAIVKYKDSFWEKVFTSDPSTSKNPDEKRHHLLRSTIQDKQTVKLLDNHRVIPLLRKKANGDYCDYYKYLVTSEKKQKSK